MNYKEWRAYSALSAHDRAAKRLDLLTGDRWSLLDAAEPLVFAALLLLVLVCIMALAGVVVWACLYG